MSRPVSELSTMASMALDTARHLRVRAMRLADGRVRVEVRAQSGALESEWEGRVEDWSEALHTAHAARPSPSSPEPKRDSSSPA